MVDAQLFFPSFLTAAAYLFIELLCSIRPCSCSCKRGIHRFLETWYPLTQEITPIYATTIIWMSSFCYLKSLSFKFIITQNARLRRKHSNIQLLIVVLHFPCSVYKKMGDKTNSLKVFNNSVILLVNLTFFKHNVSLKVLSV